MTAAWVFPGVRPFEVQSRDLSEDNFAKETRSSLEILIREALQNPIDARASDNKGPVRVRINLLPHGHFDADYLAGLLGGDFEARLIAAGGDPLPDLSCASVLVMEDFGTSGLQGAWDNPDADGPGENWNAFWFREGEGAKAAGSNGRAGQGKVTYYRIGAARAVFGFSVRKSDTKQLLMGRSAFRRVYSHKGSKYHRHSFWCVGGGEQPLPLCDAENVAAFRSAFGLSRLSEPGLSLVIPFAVGFEPKEAIRTIITDFYYPIVCGRLEVSIGGLDITSASVDAIAEQVLSDEVAREKKSSFTKGFRMFVREVIDADRNGIVPVMLKPGWDKSTLLKDDAFPEGALGQLKSDMERGERVAVRFPVNLREKSGGTITTWFDVHLQVPEELDRAEEAYIRRDLLIGAESHLMSSAYLQKARGLTLIEDSNLSAFLADAEEPTHLKWNGCLPRLTEAYMSPQAPLRAVRNAAPRLLALVSNGLVKRDVKALVKYFTKPADEGKSHQAGGEKQGGKEIKGDQHPPLPIRKPFRITADADRVHVLPNGNAAPTADELPIECVLELAYEGLDLNPFHAYDPFDFDLDVAGGHDIIVSGASITLRKGNRVAFSITDPAFALEVGGFDSNIRLRARLNYTEKNNGTTVGDE